jgi:hypothetical protein
MDELTKSALVGTSKLSSAPPLDGHPATALVTSVTCDEREDALLLSAGARCVYGLAGARPRAGLAAVEPAPAHTKKIGSRKIAGLIQNAIAAKADFLLVEFLKRMHEAEIALPPDLLPAVLNFDDADVRRCALPVLGERGEWLSRQNPDWAWVHMGISHLTASDQRGLKHVFDEGGISARCEAIRTLRSANPTVAREWVAEVFAREKPNHRANLLEALDVGLSLDDEAFLESCLSDRSTNVSQLAARHLCRLPQSALAARMRARADAMLSVETSGIIRKQIKLLCSPPEKIERDWERDGIPKQAPAGRGLRAFWAESTLAAVLPSHWASRFGLAPSKLMEAAREGTFAEAVLAGWTNAAAQFSAGDPASAEWLLPLWQHWADATGRAEGVERNQALERMRLLVPQMSKADAESALMTFFKAGSATATVHGLSYLPILARPWSDEFSSALLKIVRNVVRSQTDNAAYQWANSLLVIARAIPEAVFAEALTPWTIVTPEGTAGWHVEAVRREIDKFTDTIETRASFMAELRA